MDGWKMKFLFEFLRGDELGSSLMTAGQRTRITVHIKLIGGETTRPAEFFFCADQSLTEVSALGTERLSLQVDFITV